MKLFETLSARLAARGIRDQLYIVGGSAMIVAERPFDTLTDCLAALDLARDSILARARSA